MDGETPDIGKLEKLKEEMDEMLNKLAEISSMDPTEFEEMVSKLAGGSPVQTFFNYHTIFILCIITVVFILAFFGCKVYKSVADKERKREEKRRIKQMKKRKIN